MISNGADLPDQTENYMFYSGELCQNTFTHNQREIMYYTLLKERTALVDPVHLNKLNLPCATFSAYFKPASNTVCQNDTVKFTALRYADSLNAKYVWVVKHNNSIFKTDSGINLYSVNYRLTSLGTYEVILTVKTGSSVVSDTIIDAVLAQNCGTPKASTQGNWYFGQYAGVRFSSTNSVISSNFALIGGIGGFGPTINSDEGCVSQSTSDGRLLFYGGGWAEMGPFGYPLNDSFYVFDKTHQLMPHGVLMGSSSSTQGGVIVPHPTNGARFYLVTTNHLAAHPNFNPYLRGTRWSLIDTALNSGKGDVMIGYRNVPVRVPLGVERVNSYDSAVWTGEGIAAIPHCDGMRHWLVTGSGNDMGSKKVHILISDTNGIFYHHSDSMPNSKFTMFSVTASKDGNFVCISGNLFSFDRVSGRLAFLKNLDSSGLTANYSEFSPNSTVLYTVLLYEDTMLIPFMRQTDLRSSALNSTIFPLRHTNRMPQLGPDGKIYISQYDEGYLSVINYPDSVNTQTKTNACDYNKDVVSLNPNGTNMLSKIGLPNMVDAFSPNEVGNSFNYMATACKTYNFRPVIDCSDFYIWDFGDGDTAHGYSVTHAFDSVEEYTVTLYTDQDTVTRIVKAGMHLSPPEINGPVIICDTSTTKQYSMTGSGNLYMDSIGSLTWISYSGNLQYFNHTKSMLVKWMDEGKLTLVYKDRYGCVDSVWIDVELADTSIHNNTIHKADTIYCNRQEITTITGTIPGGGAGNYLYYWYSSESSTGPWFQVRGEYDDTLFNAYPDLYYYRKVVSDGCKHESNIIEPSNHFITNNTITDSSLGCNTFKLIGSLPNSPTSSFRYRWFIDGGNGFFLSEDDTLKDIIPATSKNDLFYYREVMSGSCITRSNTLKVVNFDQNNYIAKLNLPGNLCSPTIWGSNLDLKFPTVSFQWQTSIDNENWSIIPGETGKSYENAITDTIIRYYRREAKDTNCTSYSNVIENRAVYLSTQPFLHNTCAANQNSFIIKYAFNKPPFIGNIDIIWQLKKVGSGQWMDIYNSDYLDTQSILNDTVQIIGAGTELIEEGDTLRMLNYYACQNSSYQFYSNWFTIKSDAGLTIISQPENITVNAGNSAMFRVVLNYPQISHYVWQYSKTGYSPWQNLPNSDNDTFNTELTGGCSDSMYYRVKITHPCETKYSDSALIKINPSTPAFDYWIKDQWLDTGREFNLDSIDIMRSPDIWVRHKKDGIKLHQYANCAIDTNWVYVTIRNKGSQPTKAGKVFLYWSWGSTGEWWDENWTENINNTIFTHNGAVLVPMGGEINKEGHSIKAILPGKSVNIALPWTNVPSLKWYDLDKTFWQNKINVCLLARIQTCDEEPFGMAYNETRNVRRNAQYNNNIAIKNTFVIHLYPPKEPTDKGKGGYSGGQQFAIKENIVNSGTIVVRNKNQSDIGKLCINLKQTDYFSKANAFIEIGESLHSVWVAGGSASSGIEHVFGRIYKLTSVTACLSNLALSARFQDNIQLLFGYKNLKNRFGVNEKFDFAIRQYDSSDIAVGECHFEVKDNAFYTPSVLNFTDEQFACDFDGFGGYLKYNVPCPDFPYSIWDVNQSELIANNSTGEYHLLPGEYVITCNDIQNAQILKTTLTVSSSPPTEVNGHDTILYDCEFPDSVDFEKTCENGVMYDRYDQVVNESSSGHYTLDPQGARYTFVCADSANCIKFSTMLTFRDMPVVPASTSNYLTGMYNREENQCCFIDLTEVECDGETPLIFGQEIEVYNMDAELLYKSNLELYGGTVLGFRFCPPHWDTSSNVISNWYSIVIRNDECSYCRMDFMCDSVGDPEPFVILNYPSGKTYSGIKKPDFKIENKEMLAVEEKPKTEKLPASISVYPNPAGSLVNMKAINVNSESLNIQIRDATGKTVFVNTYKTANGNLSTGINTSDFASGVYTIYIAELNYYFKLIIIK